MINHFLDYLKHEKNYADHTITAYKADLIKFAEFVNQEFQLQDLKQVSYALIRQWMIELTNLNHSTLTINRKLSSLKSYFNYLLKLGEIESHPMQKHQPLKQSKQQQLAFSKAEVNRLDTVFDLTNFKGARDQLVIELLYQTGIRRQELINLQLTDINLSSQHLKVLGKRQKERQLPITAQLSDQIQHYIGFRPNNIESRNLILTNTFKPAYPNLIYRIVNTYFKQVSEKKKCSPHILRHSFATHLLENGADLVSIKELLGHSSLASTQHYTKANMLRLKQVLKTAHPRSKQ